MVRYFFNIASSLDQQPSGWRRQIKHFSGNQAFWRETVIRRPRISKSNCEEMSRVPDIGRSLQELEAWDIAIRDQGEINPGHLEWELLG